jgi:hypothetical protein
MTVQVPSPALIAMSQSEATRRSVTVALRIVPSHFVAARSCEELRSWAAQWMTRRLICLTGPVRA